MNKWKCSLVSRRCCTRCFLSSSRHAPRCLFSRSHLSCSFYQASLQPNQSPHAPGSPRASTQWVLHFTGPSKNNRLSSTVLLLPALLPWIDIAVFLLFYCCVELCTGHPRPSRRSGPSVPWVSLPGPTGVPTDTQAEWNQGQSANPLAAALLLRLLQLLHARAINIGHAFTDIKKNQKKKIKKKLEKFFLRKNSKILKKTQKNSKKL